jgi:L-lactate dehydrogenase complex protein LldG
MARLRLREEAVEHPGDWPVPRAFPDLVKRFVTALEAAHGEVYVEADLPSALERLEAVLHELRAGRIVCQDEPPLNRLDLPRRLSAFTWYVVGETTSSLRQQCAAADVGVSGARAALAETGTVLVESGHGRSRLVTLLPPVHVVLLPSSLLVADLFAWVAQHERPMPANFTLISGPSKTADIEQTLAIGVHGPRRFIVIVYD